MLPSVQKLRGSVRSYFRYEERLSPSEWCSKHIYLPPGKQETEHGWVNFEKRPYLREPIDSIAVPSVTDIVFAGPTRIGKTFFLRMGFAYSVAGDPAPMLWVDSTETKGRDISKKELQPMIEASEVLRDRKPLNRHNMTDLRMLFPGASFTIVGGNSDAQVAGDTVKRVLGNELDKWRAATEKEASIAELVRHRTESFDEERKHLWSSTPTLEELTTWRYYLRGDQRLWQCLCPDCTTFQALHWQNVKWDPGAQITEHKWDLRKVKESARYKCERVECGSEWNDDMRRAAIRHKDAHWKAGAVGEPGWRSYHLNGLYGPLKSNNVGELAVDFLSARTTGFYANRQDFWNSRMGLPWRDKVSEVSVEKFASLERSYQRGDGGPEGFKPDVLIISFDVQSNRIPWTARAYSWTGDSYGVDHGNAATWKDLEQIQEDYRKLGCSSYVIGDINYEERRAEALEQIFIRKHRGWYGAEGFEKASELVRLEAVNPFLGGKRQKDGCTVQKLVISLYDFKVELEKRFSGEIKNWFCYQLPLVATEQEIEEQKEYYVQLLDEYRRPRKRPIAGKPQFEFVSRNKNNHFFDCETYGLALFWVLSKQRSYAVRKPAPANRQTVSVGGQ